MAEAAAATTTPPEEETMEQCVARHMANDPELTEESARAACEQERKKPEPPAEPTAEAKGYIERMMAVFDEAMKKQMSTFWVEVDKKIKDAVAKVQDDSVKALRKGLGISEDPVIHLSELPELVRKTMLDLKPHGKKSETATPAKPTQGEKKPSERIPSADKTFEELMKRRTGF